MLNFISLSMITTCAVTIQTFMCDQVLKDELKIPNITAADAGENRKEMGHMQLKDNALPKYHLLPSNTFLWSYSQTQKTKHLDQSCWGFCCFVGWWGFLVLVLQGLGFSPPFKLSAPTSPFNQDNPDGGGSKAEGQLDRGKKRSKIQIFPLCNSYDKKQGKTRNSCSNVTSWMPGNTLFRILLMRWQLDIR